MSGTAGADSFGPAGRLGLQPGMVIQELGWDDDVDSSLRDGIEQLLGTAMVDDDYGDVCDGGVLWWREDDGDLVDGLVDALTDLAAGGSVWLLTPKVGRPDHVDPSEISEAARTAGLATTSSVATGDWTATRLVAPKGAGQSRR